MRSFLWTARNCNKENEHVLIKDKQIFLITSILKSPVILVILLALIGAMHLRNVTFSALNRMFFPATEDVLLKYNNQSEDKTCSKKPIQLQENKKQLMQLSSH